MTVFANNLEVSCKAQANKVIAAFPDVCMTPPEAPPTPPGVPIPYPNFGFDSDTDKGTGTVKIGGKTINQKNVSYFTKTTGDEAGAAAKKGVVSSKNTGKSYSQAFSMDVKAEGKNLTRFSDISTGNHGTAPNTPPMPKVGTPGGLGFSDDIDCLVGQYDTIHKECNDRGGQAHHVVPDQMLRVETSTRKNADALSALGDKSDRRDSSYPTVGEGCCICVGGYSVGSPPRNSTQEKADKWAADNGAPSFAGQRGHGFLHQFEGRVGDAEITISKAVETSSQLLDEIDAYEHSIIKKDCADTAKECIENQFAEAMAKKPEPTCKVKKAPSENAISNLGTRLTKA
jgi:hypothetical protein